MQQYCGKSPCPGNIDALNVDILGRGVLAAFITTAGLTIGSIIAGYLLECLPGARTNDVDELILRGSRKIRQWVRRPFSRQSSSASFTQAASLAKAEKRASTLEQFVLALSDQQLITGTAILVAVFAEPCDVSVVSFRTATSMAWFSSTTHLATLSILHGYFENLRWALSCRVFIMLIFMVLLVSAEFLNQSERLSYSQNWEYAFSCVVTNNGTRSNILPGKPSQVFSLVVLLIWLTAAYANRLLSLYSHHWKTLRSWPWRLCAEFYSLDCNPPPEKKARATFSTIQWRLNNRLWRNVLPPHIIIAASLVSPVQHELSNSFLYEIVWFLFGLSFGINQVIKLLNSNKVKTLGAAGFRSITGFGQLLPLLLLAVPLLAIVDGFNGSSGASKEETTQLTSVQPVPAEEPPDAEPPAPYILNIRGDEWRYQSVFELPGARGILILEFALWVGSTQSFAILASNREWVNVFDALPLYVVALVLYLWGSVWWELTDLVKDWKEKRRGQNGNSNRIESPQKN